MHNTDSCPTSKCAHDSILNLIKTDMFNDYDIYLKTMFSIYLPLFLGKLLFCVCKEYDWRSQVWCEDRLKADVLKQV